MPVGCATWPAFWTLSSTGPWPAGGEVDIIEGTTFISFSPPSRVTHASTSERRRCQREHDKPSRFAYYRKLRDARRFLAPAAVWVSPVFRVHGRAFNLTNLTCHRVTGSTNCDGSANANQGCIVDFSNSGPSYGTAFNSNGGGYYAMSKSPATGIQVWFWPRNSASVPSEISQGVPKGQAISTAAWGDPAANFPMLSGYCDYASHFNAHAITFDLTFCVSGLSSHLLSG